MDNFEISGNIVDINNNSILSGTVIIKNGIIANVKSEPDKSFDFFIMPGFIDSHVHIESSMLVPTEFARMAVVHGTVATVSDPHEIANVMGISGIHYMIDNGMQVPFKFYFGAPSCVPATIYESAGAEIASSDIRDLLKNDNIKYLSEMMNYPGVLNEFPDVMTKLKIAKEYGKPIDGHAPGLRGIEAKKYVNAGISTDHECCSLEEAKEKISYGMKILIREGSAAKNFEALHTLIGTDTENVMLCCDDIHPDDLQLGHINLIVKRAIHKGLSIMKVLKVAILNPVNHYKLDVGLLRIGDPADFIIIDNFHDLNVLKTYIDGTLVAENKHSFLPSFKNIIINNFNIQKKVISDYFVHSNNSKIRVIEALEGQLLTNEISADEKVFDGNVVSDIDNDILKIAVLNRYESMKPAIGFIKNFGLKKGAIATSVGHDSHNIIAVGVNDTELCNAVNVIIENKGGLSVVNGKETNALALPVAGLMASENAYFVAEKYSLLNKKAKELGSNLTAPFMTLSFMALLVIPKLKLSDKGLFDGEKFEFVNLHTE